MTLEEEFINRVNKSFLSFIVMTFSLPFGIHCTWKFLQAFVFLSFEISENSPLAPTPCQGCYFHTPFPVDYKTGYYCKNKQKMLFTAANLEENHRGMKAMQFFLF